MGGVEHNDSIVVQPSSSTLQVPPLNRPRTPTDQQKESKHEEEEQVTELQIPVTTLQIPGNHDSTEVQTIPVKPKISPSDSEEK